MSMPTPPVGDAPVEPEPNAVAYDRKAPAYDGQSDMQFPELAILRRLRGRWDDASVLDLGVGAGRTAHTLTAIAGDYVGLDYTPAMIDLARAAISEDDRTKLAVGDARDLSFLGERRFELVLFSFNGIDYVGHEDRLRILAEMRAHTADDGWCAFSSHSLLALPLTAPPPVRPSLHDPLQTSADMFAAMRRRRVVQRVNAEIDLATARERGWALIRDEDRSLITYYVDPAEQRRQLEQSGFELVETLDLAGRTVEPGAAPPDLWLHYVCRPRL